MNLYTDYIHNNTHYTPDTYISMIYKPDKPDDKVFRWGNI